MSSPIAFSITWAQLERLRELPSYEPRPIDGTLAEKGLVYAHASLLGAGPLRVVPTPSGEALRRALARLARS